MTNQMMNQKGKEFIFYSFIAVLCLVLLLIGSFISLLGLNYFIQSNDYVLCNVYDLKKSNDILNGNVDEYKYKVPTIKVNFTGDYNGNG